ncbi:MAG: preprotein translocase subunit SecG [Candidatus Omnitrophica bacterium]|nr:preprotein translocase subunit SecG [Candidatus Omnitrophota bacterium]MDD5610318.1 preprotein translocase subunit SecG [Candidatus Omnitrophota bacterium]
MFTFVLIIHILVCAGLIGLILIQQGKGGGLVDSFSGVESMFGTKTNTFLTQATATLATLFIITCLSLALMSSQRNKSVLERVKIKTPAVAPAAIPVPAEQKTQPAAVQQTPAENAKPIAEPAPVPVPAGQNQTSTP